MSKKYEELLKEAQRRGITVEELELESQAKGLCCGDVIAIRKGLTEIEKGCVLAEEMGHYSTGVGDITAQDTVSKQKQERTARAWAYKQLVPEQDIKDALEAGYWSIYDIAEYLGVTELFLLDCLDYYDKKHGTDFLDWVRENVDTDDPRPKRKVLLLTRRVEPLSNTRREFLTELLGRTIDTYLANKARQ